MSTPDPQPALRPPHRPLGVVGARVARVVHRARFLRLRILGRGRVRAAAVPITARGVRILPPSRVTLGRNVALGRHMYVETDLVVGDDVLFSGYVAIVSDVHPVDGPGTVFASVRDEDQTVVFEGDNLVGHGVVVIGPCHFERGAVAGAGAVVTGRLTADTIHVGVPGRPLRQRRRGPDGANGRVRGESGPP